MENLEIVLRLKCKWNESDYTAVNPVSAGCSLYATSNKALNSIYRPLGRIITEERVFFSGGMHARPCQRQGMEL